MTNSSSLRPSPGVARNDPTPVEYAPLKGGELNAAVTSALVGIQTEYLGRGPKRASTFYHRNVLVTLMHEGITAPEKVLLQANQGQMLGNMRHAFQDAMEGDMCTAVERLTGRNVLAFISGSHNDPDIAAEVFILDASL
jgi:uncharacterized protein YbcI